MQVFDNESNIPVLSVKLEHTGCDGKTFCKEFQSFARQKFDIFKSLFKL